MQIIKEEVYYTILKKKKPSVNIKEGIFYNDIDGYSIKIENKNSSNNLLNDILIYDHTDNDGNKKVISAKSGKNGNFR